MIATAEWKGTSHFEGRSESGHTLLLDAGKEHTAGPSPMELVLIALCACTSVDVTGILAKKRQDLTSLVVTAHADQAPDVPHAFSTIHLTYKLAGSALTRKAVEDAVALSKQKYCSVSAMLQQSVAITASIEFQGDPA